MENKLEDLNANGNEEISKFEQIRKAWSSRNSIYFQN